MTVNIPDTLAEYCCSIRIPNVRYRGDKGVNSWPSFFFVLLTLLYTVVSAKIDEWITISALGFKSETPLMFLKWPRLYDVVRIALFLLAVMVALAMEELPWYMGLVVLGAAWLGAGWIGRKKAFKNYRQILQEMMHSAETPDEKHQYEAESKKTDEELAHIVQVSMKMGI